MLVLLASKIMKKGAPSILEESAPFVLLFKIKLCKQSFYLIVHVLSVKPKFFVEHGVRSREPE